MHPVTLGTQTSLRDRFLSFVAEQNPFALALAADAFDHVTATSLARPDNVDALRPGLMKALRDSALWPEPMPDLETTPGVTVGRRIEQGIEAFVEACDGFLDREAIALTFTDDERIEMLRGMILTRAVDLRLKAFFSGSEVRYGNTPFQGKGFRSLGQEAIYACALRLRRGPDWRGANGEWLGDVIAPIIRDVGAALCMRPDGDTVRMILSAQMGKAGPPMDGRDLHVGDFNAGILPAAAPLSIGSLTVAGMGLAFKLSGSDRVGVSFIGEGGSSLGEWHEAINMCAARQLPVVFCVQNNQTALSTPVGDQSAVRVFADKAIGYGVPGITIDGSRSDRRSVHLGRRARPCRARSGTHRAGRDADVRARASRRHAVSRQGSAAVVDVSAARAAGLCQSRALRVLVGARSDRDLRLRARAAGRDSGRRSRALPPGRRGDGRSRSAARDRGAVARCGVGHRARDCRRSRRSSKAGSAGPRDGAAGL
jgi:TPP-dependent pyruvate/acetoin dehydrogenase alpha subunit